MTAMEIISEACQGLLFPSETDADIVALTWPLASMPDLTAAALLAHEELPSDGLVETVDFDTFFDRYSPGQSDPGDKSQQSTLKKLQELRAALASTLNDPAVFRVGEINIAIYILGRIPGGDVAGVKTYAVET